MKLFKRKEDSVFLSLLVLFLVSSMSAVTYFNSNGVFDAQITYVNNEKLPYSVIVELDKIVDSQLDFDIEVIYSKDNLVVGSESFTCLKKFCESKLNINKIFFDMYEIVIRTRYEGKFYEKKLKFNLEEPPASFEVVMDNLILLEEGKNLVLEGEVVSRFDEDREYFFQVFPKKRSENVQEFNLSCQKSEECFFSFNISSQIFFNEEYVLLGYSQIDSYEKSFRVVYLNQNVSNELSKVKSKTLYDNDDGFVKARVKVSKNGKTIHDINTLELNYVNVSKGIHDVEFSFDKKSKVKNIKVKDVEFDKINIGFEELPRHKVNNLNRDISHAFAIDPKLPEYVENYSITFVATGFEVLKCAKYNFSQQTCLGSYEKILDTIPGREYTIYLTPTDPSIIQVNDIELSPTDALCQDGGSSPVSGWDASNCDDTSYIGDKTCPNSGSTGEYTFCNDNGTYVEVQSANRAADGGDGGVNLGFNDLTHSACEVITKVEVLYQTWVTNNKLTANIQIDADGDGFTTVATSTATTEPTGVTVFDATNSLPGGETWNCSDFFSASSTARLRNLGTTSNKGPFNLNTDVLYYRVSYNYTTNGIQTEFGSYYQEEEVKVDGFDIWSPNTNVSVNITRADSTVDTQPTQTTNGAGNFTFNYSLGAYYVNGSYTIFAVQDNDSTINATYTFDVLRREPIVTTASDYFSNAEIVTFNGVSRWKKNSTVNITQKLPDGSQNVNYYKYENTSLTGTFEHNWTAFDDLTTDSGSYEFTFYETLNDSYIYKKNVTYVFRPNGSSTNLVDINESDDNTFNVGGSGGTDNFDISFPQVLPTSGVTVDNFTVSIEYTTTNTVSRVLQWFNDSSGTYQTICTIPDASVSSVYECDLTSQVLAENDHNSVNIRLEETGGPSDNWNIDFVFVKRLFSATPPIVQLKNPQNDSWYNFQSLLNLTYNVTSQIYNMSKCELYIDGDLNQTNTTITNDVDQNFTLSSVLSEGQHTWMVSCQEDSTDAQVGNSSIWYITIDLTDPTKVDLLTPVDNTFITINSSTYEGNFTDNLGLKNATLQIWNSSGSLIGTNFTNLNNGTQQNISLYFEFPYEGLFYWNYLVYDRAGNYRMNESNNTITYDETKPNVILDSPDNDTYTNSYTNSFTGNFTDNLGLKNATLQIWNSSGSLIGTNSTTITGFTNQTTLDFTFPYDGVFEWNYLVYDNSGNFNVSGNNRTITVDLTAPTVLLIDPGNDTYSGLNSLFTANFTDAVKLKNATLHIWNSSGDLIGTNSTTIDGTTNSSSLGFTFTYDGIFEWNYLVYDEAGNSRMNESNFTVNVDISPPTIISNFPRNNTYQNRNPFNFTANLTDNINLKNLTLRIYNSSGSLIGTNATTVSGTSNSSELFFTFTEGQYSWFYEILDLADNSNSTLNRTFVYDITNPATSFVIPTDNSSWISRDWIYVNMSTSDANDVSSFIDFNYSLQGYWNFENVSVATVYDSSTNSQSGNLINGSFIREDVNIRGEYGEFVGVKDYMEVLPVMSGNVVTYGGWIKWDEIKGGGIYDVPIQQANATDHGFEIYAGNFDDLHCWDGIASTSNYNGLNVGQWYHVVCRHNGTDMSLYVDGNLITSTASIRNVVNENFYLGGGVLQDDYWFNGSIDEVFVFNKALSLEEIKALYDSNVNKLDINYTSLNEGSYDFYGCSIDSAGNQNCTETRTVNIDTVFPQVSYESPTPLNDSYVKNEWVYVNVSLTELNLDTINLEWNGVNESLPCNGSAPNYICSVNKTGLADGSYNFKVYVNDSVSHINSTQRNYVYVDGTFPLINFIPPTDNDSIFVNRSWTYVNVSVSDGSDTSAYIDFNRSLVGYWNFENYNSTHVQDSSTYGFDGSFQGNATVNTTVGIRGKFAQFDGDGDYIKLHVTNVAKPDTNEDYSISLWVKGGTKGGLISSSEVVLTSFWNMIDTGINIISNEGGSGGAINLPYSIPNDNDWHNFVIVLNRTTSPDNLSLYIDGVFNKSATGTLDGGSLYNPGIINIGKPFWGNSPNLNGSIDEVMFFKRTLTPVEVKALYNSKINPLYNNISRVNGNYTYYACAQDVVGHMNCTETRNININRTLPEITINYPSQFKDYYGLNPFNVSTKVWAQTVTYSLDGNSNVSMSNTTPTLKEWYKLVYNVSLKNHTINFWAIDDVGNVVNKSFDFYIIANKSANIVKKIGGSNIDKGYNVTVNLTNYGYNQDYNVYDFVDVNSTHYNYNPSLNGSVNVSGSNYIGDVLKWNVSLSPVNSYPFYYNFNWSGYPRRFANNYIVGLD